MNLFVNVCIMRLIFLTKNEDTLRPLWIHAVAIQFQDQVSSNVELRSTNHNEKSSTKEGARIQEEETLVYFDNVAPFCWCSFPEKCQSSKVKIVSIEPDQFCNNTPNLIDFIQESGSASNWHSLPSSSLINFERY